MRMTQKKENKSYWKKEKMRTVRQQDFDAVRRNKKQEREKQTELIFFLGGE